MIGLLDYINPAGLNYQEWLNVGMALHYEGLPAADVWENWSKRDARRYHAGECARKWAGFHSAQTPSPVTGATIVKLAKEGGWRPSRGRALDWNDTIEKDAPASPAVNDADPAESRAFRIPETWDPVEQLITYLETLFESTDMVGYVTRATKGEGDFSARISPSKGCWDRTAGQLINKLLHCGGDIGAVLGDYNPAYGAWIRFNPLDGRGVGNANVTDFRYALVESDHVDLEKQNAIIRALELPVAALVYSGGKSLHAIVRIEASDAKQYRQRVEYLYRVCNQNGLEVDPNNKNPSRLSRMPGVVRNGRKQYLLDTNIGKPSWGEWVEWIESVDDDLPDPENLADVWDDMPPLSPPLIDGVLRQGHKMLIAGPSKAGKSYALLELCCAIAEGKDWLGFRCAQGKVLYVNLELDRASCLHRLREVYERLGWQPENARLIDMWHLRGRSVPMDQLAPKLIRRAAKKQYIAVIFDPIYKVITGDENSADQMARFCNQFDKICTQLGCAVIYCHHHSKGLQGQKRSMDRASGSGVFARDPDALLDLIELDVTDGILQQERQKAVCRVYADRLERLHLTDRLSPSDALSESGLNRQCRKLLDPDDFDRLTADVRETEKAIRRLTAWRVEGTLREFPKFPPVNIWFDHPVHRVDTAGVLDGLEAESERPIWEKASDKRKEQAEKQKEKQSQAFADAFRQLAADGGNVEAAALAEALEVKAETLNAWLGDGKKSKENLKKDFEIFTGEDSKRYVRQVR